MRTNIDSINSVGQESSQNTNVKGPLRRTFRLVLMSDQYRYTKTTATKADFTDGGKVQ